MVDTEQRADPKSKAKAVIERLKELAEGQSPPKELSKAKAAAKALREETKSRRSSCIASWVSRR